MWYIRSLQNTILEISKSRPSFLLTGLRQSGKSSLLKHLFPNAQYISFDNLNNRIKLEENPTSFLEQLKDERVVILDEIQYVPELFQLLKIEIDNNRTLYGKWLLTGSQKFHLMEQVSDSLAGRISIKHLETLSSQEISSLNAPFSLEKQLFNGGFPELWSNPGIDVPTFFEDYVQTYLERDVRHIINISNLRDFQRLLRSCAMRAGQLLNYADLAKDLGVSPNTVKNWFSVLETSGVISLLPPYYTNLGKRLIKAPKIYFNDTGLLCHLLNITNSNELQNHLYWGAIWENYVFTEIIKSYDFSTGRDLFFYRDQNNVEIDFVIEKNNQVTLIEAKSSEQIPVNKLNFKKVAPLLKLKTSCFVAHPIKDDPILKRKDFTQYNPKNVTIKALLFQT
jgi:predicted AAA+ superfamily ATPase